MPYHTPLDPLPRPLETTFNKHGHTYEQSIRTDNAAIFNVFLVAPHAKRLIGYELIRVRVKEAANLPGGKTVPRREVYPNDEEFGRHGWYFSYGEFETVLARFKLLLEEENHGPTE